MTGCVDHLDFYSCKVEDLAIRQTKIWCKVIIAALAACDALGL